MSGEGPYNPLDKINLARSIEIELLARPADSLGAIDHVAGAGVSRLGWDRLVGSTKRENFGCSRNLCG